MGTATDLASPSSLQCTSDLNECVRSGGLTKAGRWKMTQSKDRFLFPVKAKSKVFRARYLEQLRNRCQLRQPLLNELYTKNWVVYAKRPFAHSMDVAQYLGRYTYKVAISNHRLLVLDDQTVTFTYKDYRQGGKKLEARLNHSEFIRRFAMHILPRGFMRIRHNGILSSTSKHQSLIMIREQIPPEVMLRKEPRNIAEPITPGVCPHFKTETMITLEILPSRGPPSWSQLRSEIGNEI